MINIKSQKEIEIMKKGGQILAETLWEVLGIIKPGVSELEIDALAEKLIKEKGGEPGFKKVVGYKNTICVSTNDVVVHGIPSEYKFKEGDIVGIDCGVFYGGFHTDMSETVIVGSSKDKEIQRFLDIGKEALEEGIIQAKTGNHVGDISKTIQNIVEVQNGYSVVRSLVGHGVGKDLHEDPEIPGFLVGKIDKSPLLKEGMVIAVEVIYNMGSPDMILDDDGWTLRTKDGMLAGLFERTIAITKNGPLVLTK
ncbi:MAG TPA: type I methionyl aminopeptidase [Candidatus Sulfotelmatobacter sp.]|nr:type I methionyl aminopeptidase [Candidatus Sulfotelmatobacter sp.]